MSIKLNHRPNGLAVDCWSAGVPPAWGMRAGTPALHDRRALESQPKPGCPHPRFDLRRPGRREPPHRRTTIMAMQYACPGGREERVPVKCGGGVWRVLLAVGVLAAPPNGAVTARDDTGHPVTLARAARRVVSLAPSATELIFA